MVRPSLGAGHSARRESIGKGDVARGYLDRPARPRNAIPKKVRRQLLRARPHVRPEKVHLWSFLTEGDITMSTTQYSISLTSLEKAAERPVIAGLGSSFLTAASRAYGFYRTRRAL